MLRWKVLHPYFVALTTLLAGRYDQTLSVANQVDCSVSGRTHRVKKRNDKKANIANNEVIVPVCIVTE